MGGGGGGGGGKGGGKTLDCSSMTLKRPTYQILASCYGTLLKVFGGGLESEFSVHI